MRYPLFAAALMAGTALSLTPAASMAETPKRGGILNYVVASDPPSLDGHMESTFGVIHPTAPFYSLLIRINPENPQENDFVCDICETFEPNADQTQWTFKIRKGVVFHDGTPLTAHDVVATYNKIIFPPEGVRSVRQAWYGNVERVHAPDDYTFVMDMKYASAGFLPALAEPFNYIYSKKDLDTHGYRWHMQNVNGTGPFKFTEFQTGAFISGERHDKYHHMGADGKPQPYMDGFKAVIAPKMAIRLQAIRGDRAAIEFRGFPPKARDDLVNALGDQITVQESDWNVIMGYSINSLKKPFDDYRVRRALTLAVDRYGSAEALSQIAVIKTVGGLAFPGSPIAATEEELGQLVGYGGDMDARRAEARQLLKEAGADGMKITLWNRAVDQPYKVVGTFLVDQWRQIGLNSDQAVVPSGQWYDGLRVKKDFDVSIDFNARSVVNPLGDAAKWVSSSKSPSNYGNWEDPELDQMWETMNRSIDPAEQRQIFRTFEKRVLDEKAYWGTAYWWYKINPHRSYVKGWKIAPSHYLNQQLDTVWLDK